MWDEWRESFDRHTFVDPSGAAASSAPALAPLSTPARLARRPKEDVREKDHVRTYQRDAREATWSRKTRQGRQGT